MFVIVCPDGSQIADTYIVPVAQVSVPLMKRRSNVCAISRSGNKMQHEAYLGNYAVGISLHWFDVPQTIKIV
jgi:hypothetical protein